MERLKRFTKLVSVAGLLLASFAGGKAEEWLKLLKLPLWLEALLTLAAILIIFVAVGECAELAVSSSPWLRRHILGHQCVEGTWMDIVRHGTTITHVGIVRISIVEGELMISGENYTTRGILESSFHSAMHEFKWPKLSFISSSDRPGGSECYSEIRFDARPGIPKRYKGFYRDPHGPKIDYAGWRIEDKTVLERMDDPIQIRQIITELLSQHVQTAPAIEPEGNENKSVVRTRPAKGNPEVTANEPEPLPLQEKGPPS